MRTKSAQETMCFPFDSNNTNEQRYGQITAALLV